MQCTAYGVLKEKQYRLLILKSNTGILVNKQAIAEVYCYKTDILPLNNNIGSGYPAVP